MTKQEIKPDFVITDLDRLFINKHKPLYLKGFRNKDKPITYNTLCNMTFGTVVEIINNKQLYVSKVITIVDEPKVSNQQSIVNKENEGFKSASKTDIKNLFNGKET